jgi:large subunit ribosomal protein L29
MKAAKWREMSEDEVTQKVRELSEEIFNLRFQLTMGVAKNPSRIGVARRDLARAYTIIRERGGAPDAVAAAVAPAGTATAVEPAAKAARGGKSAKAAKAKAARPARAAKASAKAKPKKKAKG